MCADILVIGLNHATAPVDVRERVTFPGDQDGRVTLRVLQTSAVEEAMILSTCNRAEIIAQVNDSESTTENLIKLIGCVHNLDPESIRPYLYVKKGRDAVRHVFRVASSLDSMVVGEPQILGQVKEGYRKATEVSATGPILNRLLHRAFFTAKRIRNETGIGASAVSVAYMAVELAKKILGDLKEKAVLLVGAGEMAELAAKHLLSQTHQPIVVVNRTYENACVLARQLNGLARSMTDLEQGLVDTDVVITSTGSCEALIQAPLMKKVMKRRRYRPIFLIDIAIPRDVDPDVNNLDGVYLYNIDDLQAAVQENLGERRQQAVKAEVIVDDELNKFMKWLNTLDSAPTIVALKKKLDGIREAELARMNGKLAGLSQRERELVEMMTKTLINKIAHDPITFLKKAGTATKRKMYVDVAQRLFKLEPLIEDQDKGETSPFENEADYWN